MKCLCCDRIMTDREASRKYANHEEITNPEEKYIGLCDRCFSQGELEEDELYASDLVVDEDN